MKVEIHCTRDDLGNFHLQASGVADMSEVLAYDIFCEFFKSLAHGKKRFWRTKPSVEIHYDFAANAEYQILRARLTWVDEPGDEIAPAANIEWNTTEPWLST